MIRVWRMYGHRVGEVHATIHNLHWSVDDTMLQEYLKMHAQVHRVRVERDSMMRRKSRDSERRYGRSQGVANVIFKPNQAASLAKLFSTRHVLNGREMVLLPTEKQPEFNFYIPNTHEKEAEEMDPEIVSKMATQCLNMHMTVTGNFKHPTISKVQRQRDVARQKFWKKTDSEDPTRAPNPDEPWFFNLGEETWEDEDPVPKAHGRRKQGTDENGAPSYNEHYPERSGPRPGREQTHISKRMKRRMQDSPIHAFTKDIHDSSETNRTVAMDQQRDTAKQNPFK